MLPRSRNAGRTRPLTARFSGRVSVRAVHDNAHEHASPAVNLGARLEERTARGRRHWRLGLLDIKRTGDR